MRHTTATKTIAPRAESLDDRAIMAIGNDAARSVCDGVLRRLPGRARSLAYDAAVWMIRRRATLVLACLAASSHLAAETKPPATAPGSKPVAAPTPATPAPAATGSGACTNGRASALSEIACELAAALGTVAGTPLVVAAAIESDAKLASPERLATRLASVVAGAVGHGARSSDETARLGRARAQASRAGVLVHLDAELVRGELRVTANVYPVPKKFWSRVRDPEPSPIKHAFASRRIDAEIRTFMPPVPLVAGAVLKAVTPEQDAVALACGDTDVDGSLEIVWVGRRRIHVGKVRAGRFAPHATASWAELSPIAQSPLREPIGGAHIEPGRHVDVGISDRAQAVRFTPTLVPTAKPGRRVPWPGGGCARFNALVLRAELEACTEGDPEPSLSRFEWATDAVAGAIIVRRDGRARVVRAGRIANEPLAVLRDDQGRSVRLGGAGAQLAVGDLDGDGQPELLSGAETLDPRADAVSVHTWQDDGRVAERFRIGVPSGVRALAVCPAESAGVAPIAIATGDGLWVVR